MTTKAPLCYIHSMTKPSLMPHAYVLAVHDLEDSTSYFVDVLGFSKEWSDPGNWQGLIRDGVRLMLGHCADALSPAATGDHSYFGFFTTNDIDRLYAEFAGRNARVLAPPADKPWGWREMAVATPEGHRMMFAQAIN